MDCTVSRNHTPFMCVYNTCTHAHLYYTINSTYSTCIQNMCVY